jgi:hypothetical protein
METTLEELRALTRDLELHGAAQEDAIFELVGEMAKNEETVLNEIKTFQEVFNATHGQMEESSKKVINIFTKDSLVTAVDL